VVEQVLSSDFMRHADFPLPIGFWMSEMAILHEARTPAMQSAIVGTDLRFMGSRDPISGRRLL
jgi:hypothetical protein